MPGRFNPDQFLLGIIAGLLIAFLILYIVAVFL